MKVYCQSIGRDISFYHVYTDAFTPEHIPPYLFRVLHHHAGEDMNIKVIIHPANQPRGHPKGDYWVRVFHKADLRFRHQEAIRAELYWTALESRASHLRTEAAIRRARQRAYPIPF